MDKSRQALKDIERYSRVSQVTEALLEGVLFFDTDIFNAETFLPGQ